MSLLLFCLFYIFLNLFLFFSAVLLSLYSNDDDPLWQYFKHISSSSPTDDYLKQLQQAETSASQPITEKPAAPSASQPITEKPAAPSASQPLMEESTTPSASQPLMEESTTPSSPSADESVKKQGFSSGSKSYFSKSSLLSPEDALRHKQFVDNATKGCLGFLIFLVSFSVAYIYVRCNYGGQFISFRWPKPRQPKYDLYGNEIPKEEEKDYPKRPVEDPFSTASKEESSDDSSSESPSEDSYVDSEEEALGSSAPETKASGSSAPETKASGSSAPETKASGSSAPETKASGSSAPETKADASIVQEPLMEEEEVWFIDELVHHPMDWEIIKPDDDSPKSRFRRRRLRTVTICSEHVRVVKKPLPSSYKPNLKRTTSADVEVFRVPRGRPTSQYVKIMDFSKMAPWEAYISRKMWQHYYKEHTRIFAQEAEEAKASNNLEDYMRLQQDSQTCAELAEWIGKDADYYWRKTQESTETFSIDPHLLWWLNNLNSSSGSEGQENFEGQVNFEGQEDWQGQENWQGFEGQEDWQGQENWEDQENWEGSESEGPEDFEGQENWEGSESEGSESEGSESDGPLIPENSAPENLLGYKDKPFPESFREHCLEPWSGVSCTTEYPAMANLRMLFGDEEFEKLPVGCYSPLQMKPIDFDNIDPKAHILNFDNLLSHFRLAQEDRGFTSRPETEYTFIWDPNTAEIAHLINRFNTFAKHKRNRMPRSEFVKLYKALYEYRIPPRSRVPDHDYPFYPYFTPTKEEE